jgi:Acetyltransferase (GNAT) family
MSSWAADEGEVLDNGCRESTPAGDNVLLDYARGEAKAFGAVADAAGGRAAHDSALGLWLADSGSPSPFGNTAHLTKPIGDDATPAFVEALREFFDAGPGGPFLVFSPWPTGDLSRHGFHLVGHPPLMFRPAATPAPVTPAPVTPAPVTPAPTANPNLRVAAVETEDDLADFERTLIEAYPAPEFQPWRRGSFFAPGTLSTNWRFFVGYEDDRCVATAAAWLTDSISIVEMVSTRDECRGKGYGAAVTAAASDAQPGRTAMLIASDLGRSVYDRLGYIPLLRYTLYLGMRSSP